MFRQAYGDGAIKLLGSRPPTRTDDNFCLIKASEEPSTDEDGKIKCRHASASVGHMDHVVRRAISLGLTSIQSIHSVTLNAAACCGLEQEVAGIAPGRCADSVQLDDRQQCGVSQVLIAGKKGAVNGVTEVISDPITLLHDLLHSLRVNVTISAKIFRVAAPNPKPPVRVVVLLNQTITAERILEIDGSTGIVTADLGNDILRVAMFDRHQGSSKVAMGFLKRFGANVGAVSLTTNIDEILCWSSSATTATWLCARALIGSGWRDDNC